MPQMATQGLEHLKIEGDAAHHAAAAIVPHAPEKLPKVRVLRAAACCRTALALSPYLPSARLSAEKAEAATNKNTAPAEVVSSADEEEPANDEGEGEPAQRSSARDRSKKSAAKSTPAPAAGAVPRTHQEAPWSSSATGRRRSLGREGAAEGEEEGEKGGGGKEVARGG